jgi:hypothetical protein
MPTPITAFADAAAKYGDIDPDDIEAVQKWFADELHNLPVDTIEQVTPSAFRCLRWVRALPPYRRYLRSNGERYWVGS